MPGNPRSSFSRYPPSRAFPINSSWRKWGSDRTAKFNIVVRVGTEPASYRSKIVVEDATYGRNEEEACRLRRLNNNENNNEGKKGRNWGKWDESAETVTTIIVLARCYN